MRVLLAIATVIFCTVTALADKDEKVAIEKTKEQKLADFFEKAAVEETKRRMEKVATRIDEMARVCELTAETTRKLKIASKGAVEASLDDWRDWIQSYANSRIARAGNNVDAALAQIAEVRYGGDQTSRILNSSIWKNTLETELSAAQLAKLEASEAERLAFLHKSLTSYLVAHLDFHLRFTVEQRAEIGPLIFASVEKYTESLVNNCGGEFPQYQAISLIGGVDEDAAKEVLTDAQWKAWELLFRERGDWWEQIKANQ